jgi:hypothetical protein
VRAWAAVHELSRVWVQIARNPFSGTAKVAPHVGSIVAMELAGQSDRRILPPFVSLNAGSGPGEGYFPPEYGPFYVSPGGGGLGNTTHRDGAAAFERRFNLLLELDAETRAGWAHPPSAEHGVYNIAARTIMYNSKSTRSSPSTRTSGRATATPGSATAYGETCCGQKWARGSYRSRSAAGTTTCRSIRR